MMLPILAALLAVLGFGLFVRRGMTGDGNGFDREPASSPTSYSASVRAVARAIAYAEGFYVKGSAPQRAHNPGAIKLPGWVGATTGAEGITVFASDDQGWEALHRQLALIVDGRSGVYSLGMSIADMARSWTATQQVEWSTNVATRLNVSPSTRLSQVLA